MTIATGDGTGGVLAPTGIVSGDPPAGRDTYADRVFAKIAEHTTAQVVGVPRGDLAVEVGRYGDGLTLRVRTPLPVPGLDDRAAIDAGPPVLERVTSIQQTLRDEVGRISGRDVVRVDMRITGAVVATRRRLR